MRRNHPKRSPFVSIVILVALVSLVVLAIWFQRRSVCARYDNAIHWLSEYALPVEKIALPFDTQTCLSKRDSMGQNPALLPEGDGVELLLALESIRPDLILTDQGMVWDNVLRHPWFQSHYLSVPQFATEQDMAGKHIYAYHPTMLAAGDIHWLELEGTSKVYPSLSSYRLASPYITSEDPFSIVFYWQVGSDALALEVPSPGYQLRIQLRTQTGREIWSQVSQSLVLETQPVVGQLRLASPPVVFPSSTQALAEDLYLVAHLLHPDGRELPLYSGDSLAELQYLPDYQFKPYPEVGETSWQLGTDNVSPSIALVGFEIPRYTFPDEKVKLVLNWQALTTVNQDYKVFIHAVDDTNGNELLVAQDDSQPAAWRVPTSSWTEGMYIRDVHWLTLPSDLSRGEYQLYVGLYHVKTGERLSVSQPDAESSPADRIHLGSLWVR